MGLFSRFKKYEPEDYDDEIIEEEKPIKDNASISLGGGNIELKLIKPVSFEQLLTAVDYLKGGKTVLLNLESADKAIIRRMIDFISGAA